MRRSSLSCGIESRIVWPSFEGVRPRSDSRMPFSTAFMSWRSNGCTVSRRASGAWTVATWFSGSRVP